MGTTAQEIQRLEYAAKFAGVSADVLHMALRRVSTSAVDASRGGAESNRIFSELGVNIFDSAGKVKNSTTLMKDLADAFHRMPDGVEKTNAAVHLFGRSGPDWIPVLDKGRAGLKELGDEGERVGYVMSNENLAAGKKFTELLHELEAIVQGIARSIGIKLIPIFNELMEQLKAWYEGNKEIIAQDVAGVVYAMAHAIEMLFKVGMFLIGVVQALSGSFIGLRGWVLLATAVFLAFNVGTMGAGIVGITRLVWELVTSLKAAALWEAIATGGWSMIAGLAAGAAVLGLSAYAAYGGSGPPLDTLRANTNGSFGSAGTVNNSRSGGTVNVKNEFRIESHGTTEAQKQEIAQYVQWHHDKTLRNAASAAAGPGGF